MTDDDEWFADPIDEASREVVQRRVDDWLDRLEALFHETEDWASGQGWTADRIGEIPMNDDILHRYELPTPAQPVLRLDGPQGAYALFKPKGLWVIGANGRIDLYTQKGVFVLIDEAETFDKPLWRLFRSSAKPEGVPFAPALLGDLA